MERPTKEELKARIEAYGRSMHSAGYNEKAHLPRMRDACFSDASRFLTEIIDALFAEVPTEPMTPAALNLALAGMLGCVYMPKGQSELRDRLSSINSTKWAHPIPNDVWHKAFSMAQATCRDDRCLRVWDQRKGQPWQQEIENIAYKVPPYSTDLVTAFTLGDDIHSRGKWLQFIYQLRNIVGHDLPCDAAEFLTCHATPYDRALAAFRAMGGAEPNG